MRMYSTLFLLLTLSSCSGRLDTGWDAFHLEHSDEHLIHEHFVGWVFGHTDVDTVEYYFKAHDSDSDSKLDGLELLHALHHQNSSDHAIGTPEHFDKDAQAIDLLMRQADADDDGFLDYYEYIMSRKRYKAV